MLRAMGCEAAPGKAHPEYSDAQALGAASPEPLRGAKGSREVPAVVADCFNLRRQFAQKGKQESHGKGGKAMSGGVAPVRDYESCFQMRMRNDRPDAAMQTEDAFEAAAIQGKFFRQWRRRIAHQNVVLAQEAQAFVRRA